MTNIPEEEKTRRQLFAVFEDKGLVSPRPEHTTMYAPSGSGALPYRRFPDDQKSPSRHSAKIAFLPERTKLQDGPSG